jgi:hypothetical protein
VKSLIAHWAVLRLMPLSPPVGRSPGLIAVSIHQKAIAPWPRCPNTLMALAGVADAAAGPRDRSTVTSCRVNHDRLSVGVSARPEQQISEVLRPDDVEEQPGSNAPIFGRSDVTALIPKADIRSCDGDRQNWWKVA